MCESRPPALRRVCRIKKRLTRGCRKRPESPQRHGNRSCSNQSAPPVFHWYQYTPTPRHKSNNFPISGNYFPQRTSSASYPHTPPIHRRGRCPHRPALYKTAPRFSGTPNPQQASAPNPSISFNVPSVGANSVRPRQSTTLRKNNRRSPSPYAPIHRRGRCPHRPALYKTAPSFLRHIQFKTGVCPYIPHTPLNPSCILKYILEYTL